VSGRDDVKPGQMQLTARVEEHHDASGDLVWTLLIGAKTYDRRALDRLTESLGCELEFVPAGRETA
jgi:hypothetical protein